MNTGTLVGSLVFAAVLVVLIGLTIFLATRGWRHRAQRQASLIGTLPAVPDTVGPPTVAPSRGRYVGCTFTSSWHDRVVVGDLGYRTKAVLTGYPEGIMVQRSTAQPIWIPADRVVAIRTERGSVGKTIPAAKQGEVLAIRWRLPSGAEIDTGFRADDRGDYARWVDQEQR